jgi:hypothetical protein
MLLGYPATNQYPDNFAHYSTPDEITNPRAYWATIRASFNIRLANISTKRKPKFVLEPKFVLKPKFVRSTFCRSNSQPQ